MYIIKCYSYILIIISLHCFILFTLFGLQNSHKVQGVHLLASRVGIPKNSVIGKRVFFVLFVFHIVIIFSHFLFFAHDVS